jgi:acylphosphatase
MSLPPIEGQKAAVHLVVKGYVQGVGYRFFVQRTAEAAGLTGWVRNLPSGNVEAEAEGERLAIERWIETLKKGPWMARVERIDLTWLASCPHYSDFTIRG